MYFMDVRYVMRNIMILLLYSFTGTVYHAKKVKIGWVETTPRSSETDLIRIRNGNTGFVD